MNKKRLLLLFLFLICRVLEAKVEGYTIKGLPKPILAAIQTSLDKTWNTKQLDTQPTAVWKQQIPDAIQKALKNFGYFEAKVQTDVSHKNHKIRYQVTLGPPVYIEHINFQITGDGQDNLKLKKVANKLPIKTGQLYNTERYQRTKQALFDAALNCGYLDVQFDQSTVEIDRKRYTAVVTLLLNTGHLYVFGPVRFQQNILREKFLQRYLPFHTGQPYSIKALSQLQDTLNASGYFQRVRINALPSLQKTYQIPVDINLVPLPRNQYTVGVGYGTDTGLRGLLGWKWRYVNAWGHSLSAFLQLSQVQNSAQIIYAIPGKRPATDKFHITLAALNNNLPKVDSFTKLLGISSISRRKHQHRTFFLNYQLETFNYSGQPKQFSHLLTPGALWSYTRSDNLTYARKGYNISLRIQGALQQVLSDNSFIQGEIQGKYIRGLTPNSRVILRGDVGASWINPVANFPPSLLFYAGGSQSVRGYSYQSLGPGQNLVAGSAEYQHRIVGNFHGAIFYDAGNAFNQWPASLQQGAGLGILWVSPLGPVEITLARALNNPHPTYQLQLTLGPDFV